MHAPHDWYLRSANTGPKQLQKTSTSARQGYTASLCCSATAFSGILAQSGVGEMRFEEPGLGCPAGCAAFVQGGGSFFIGRRPFTNARRLHCNRPFPPVAMHSRTTSLPSSECAMSHSKSSAERLACFAVALFSTATFTLSPAVPTLPAFADSTPIDVRTATKVAGGSASTSAGSMRSVIKNVTRGVDLEGTNFSGQNLDGVSFQQSILRRSDFSGASLVAASFFDADLSGANLAGADLSQANFELASLRTVNATDTVLAGAYISSTTKFDGIEIVGSDWSDCLLRKDQQRYLCSRATGTNSKTGVDTRESLMCPPE